VRTRDFDVASGEATLRVRMVEHDGSGDSRPTIVFLHDSLGCIALWRDFPQRLASAAGCHALVYDRRGYGESSPFPAAPRTTTYLEEESDALTPLLERCGVGDAILFGHSDGGSIALLAAARHPARVRAVVTEGAHVFVEEITLDGIRAAREALRTTPLRERLARYHGPRTDGVTSAWIDTWLRPDFRDWNIERYLPRITVPVLVLQGVDDEFGSVAQVEAIVRGTGGVGESLLVPGAAHTPHREATNVVLATAVDFLRRHRIVDG